MATLQDVLKENKELQKKQNTTTVAPIGNPASPYNKAVQTGNPNVQAGRQKISVTPAAQKQTYTTPLQAQTAASKKAVDLVGNAIGSGVSQTLSGISNLAKSVPVTAEMGAKAISNLADAPVSPMTSKLTASEIKPKEDNFVKNFTNALFGSEKEVQTVEVPKTEQEVTKNQFRNIANKELIAQGEQPVKQITEWTDPWNNALEQNVENAQDFGQRYTQAVKPVTDFLDNASQKVDTYLNENVAPNLSSTEQFVTQAVGNAIPNFARQTLLGAVSGGSVPLLSTLSDIAMFLPSFYQGYEEGKQRGLSDEEAYFNAILRGGIEAGSEHLSDVWMVNGGQSQFDEWLLNKIALSGMNPFAKFVGKNMVSGIGESMEEVAARLGNTLTDRAIYGDNIDVGQLALGSLEDAGASFISTMVLGLLGGQYTNNAYRQYQSDVNRIQNENSIQEQLNSDANKYKTEIALVYANMTDEQKAQYLAQAQEQIAQKDPSDPVANMDIEELKDWVDRNAEKQIMGLTEEQYAKFIDRMNGAENPIAQTRLPNGQTFDVYEYLGTRTADQERAIDLGNRMGKNIIIADELPMGQNALTLGDGTVIISSNAQRPATALAFHEMFHSLKDNGQWDDLMGFAYETMTKEKGYENFLEDLVSRYVGYYGNIDNNYLNSIASSVDLTNEQKRQEVKDYLREQGVNQYYTDANFRSMIDEEVAADFMERFNNEDTIRAMYNRSGNMAEQMWQKLIDAVESFTGMLTQDEENLRRTEQMFADVARQNYEEARDDVRIADDGSAYPMYSATTWNALGEIGKDKLAEDIAKRLGMDDEEGRAKVKKWLDDINSVSATIGANRDRLDYAPNDIYSALKPNSEYKWTVDMSTLCKKRILLSNTIDEIQRHLPNVVLTGEDYIRIRQMMKDKGYEVSCGFCYVESRRKQLDDMAQLFINALNGTEMTKKNGYNTKQPAIIANTKSRDEYVPTLYDLTTAEGSNRLMEEHPDVYAGFVNFNNSRGSGKVNLIQTRTEYRGEIAKFKAPTVRTLNARGGLRLQSYSDFETPHLIDMMQVVADMSRVGLMSQAYTKVPNFADAFGKTGIKINESLVVIGVDENGNLIFDDVEGMPHEIAFALRQKHPECVGTIVVGKDDATILTAMADPRIDFIIPFHASGWANHEYEALGIKGYKNYEDWQNERNAVTGGALSDKESNIFPSEYWDYNISGDENAKKYLRLCESMGRIPKFDNFLTKDREGHWVAPSGYWKTLIDFKMYNNDGVGAPQRVVTPTFDDAVNQRILDEYEGDHNKYSPKMDIVNEFIREKGYRYSLSDDELDRQYFDALDRGDTEEARRLLNERADERGYTDRGYHGTQNFGFTVPDTQYSDDNLSFFATDDLATASTYSGIGGTRGISEGESQYAINLIQEQENAANKTVDEIVDALNRMAGSSEWRNQSDVRNELWNILDSAENGDDTDGLSYPIDNTLWNLQAEAFAYAHPDERRSNLAYTEEAGEIRNLQEDLYNEFDTILELTYGTGRGNYELAINPNDLLAVDANESQWDELLLNPEDLGVDENDAFFDEPYRTTRELAEFADHYNYPGFKLNNVFDDGGQGRFRQESPSTVYALFNPQSQVKSLDVVTYDDEGNIIPPSQRYNANNPDIRYSLDDGTEETAVYIHNGTRSDGTTIDFVDEILNRNKLGETRDNDGMPTGWQGLTRGGKNPTVVGRALFGEGYKITKDSPEYRAAMIEGTNYDIDPAVGFKYYYPVLDTEDFRDNPKPVKKNSPRRAYYSLDGEQYPSWADVPNQEGNWGYHAGDLGKAEPRFSQGYSRGTGHFGTGTYFVGNPSELRYGYGERPVESVDFSQYNLFAPQNGDDAYTLHEFLRSVDGKMFADRAYTEDEIDDYNFRASEGAVSEDPNTILSLIEEGREMLGDNFQDALDLLNRWEGTRFNDGEIWDSTTDQVIAPVTNEELLPYGEDALYAIMEMMGDGSFRSRGWANQQNALNRSYGLVNEVARILGRTPEEILNLAAEIDTADLGEDRNATDDSLATRFMKGLGYEGVDVRNVPDFDNTRYGSVIYDLKGNDLERKQANGARFSVEDIPEQANRYKEKNNPQGRAANIFLGKLSRERNAADPYTYESISPESFPVPDRIQDYIDLINDEEDRKYGFDAPIENELTDEDKDFYQGLSANRTGALQGFATPTQTFNAIAKGEQREELRDRFERPMYETKKEYNANREQRWNALENMIKETGIQANTPESAAVQWYGEGVKPNEQGETIPYTLDDLKREFPNKWQDIQKMERFMRQMYDEYVGRINAALEQVYPNLEGKAQAQLQSWRNKKQIYQDEISMSRNPSANDYWQNEINKLDRKIAKLEGDLESGEYFRNKRLNPRKDYFHHFQEVETSGLGGLKNILQASTLIDPELVGKTEFTKPKSRWMSWLQKRGEGAYTADAVLGMGKYIDSAEYAIAFDPLIAQYRDEISKMVRATRETKNANQLIQYLSAYTNQLAGKTASLDRTILDLLGEGNRGQLFNVLAAINNRAKSNAVVGNVRSAVAQIFNIPNALGIIKSNKAWLKGANDYINAKLGNRELLDQSPFLQERYFSHNVDDLKARNTNWEKIIGKAGDITNKMMEFGDREATELIWLAAYNEGLEKNVSDPIYYADDLTRRSVAGRGIGEVPYNMKSKVASFFMPFQTETNNAWQELKQNLRDKDANGIFRLMLGSYILNGFAKLLFNDGVVPDVLGALIDGIRKLFDKDREESVGEVALNTGRRMAGEAVSYIPGTSLWLPAIMSDESAEALFGDSDPTRYGTGTVGLSTITKTLADAVDGGDFDVVTPLLQMGLPYGGRQASRLYNTLQDFNVLPSNGVMNTPIGGERNPVAGDYTQAGALKYRLPEEVNSAADVAEIARALAFGSNSTNAASEYYDTLKPVLSKERVAKLREHPEVNPNTYIDYLNEASTDGKQGITQQEAYDWISSHNLSDEEANALWEMTSSSWKKSYDEYVPKTEEDTQKKETEKPSDTEKQNTKKSGKPTTKKEFTDAADANNSGRLSQAEAYDWLNSQRLSDAEKEALWNLMGWKTDYETYKSKH